MGKKLKILLMILIIKFSFLFNSCLIFGDETNALSRIEQTEILISDAYVSLLNDEKMGGDISELVEYLNTAILYHIEAKNSFKDGDVERVFFLTDKVEDITRKIMDTEFSIIVITENVNYSKFRNLLFRSLGAICIIIIYGYLGWKWFRTYYIKKHISLKPEVNISES